MKRKVLSIVSTVAFGVALGACRTGPEPEREPAPTERTGRTERTEREDEPVRRQEPRAETGVASSKQIHDRVHDALERAQGLDARSIRVVVAENGVVHLRGTVASEEEKRRAHEIAHAVAGVRNVYIGELQVDTSRAQR